MAIALVAAAIWMLALLVVVGLCAAARMGDRHPQAVGMWGAERSILDSSEPMAIAARATRPNESPALGVHARTAA